MSKPDNQVNELHLREPQPGDFWHERFCPYHIVLAVTPDGVVITDKTKPYGSSHYTFDLEAAKEITHEEHARAVRYSSGNGFAADVVPARAAGSVREWKASGSKYIPIAEQQAAPHSGEALIDTNKMRDISREQFEQRYPVPEGACWNAEQARYVLFHLKLCTVAKYERFVENWVCWQASRDAVAVELQEPDLPEAYIDEPVDRESEEFRYLEARHGAQHQTYRKCRQAIEAQGLNVEVKP